MNLRMGSMIGLVQTLLRQKLFLKIRTGFETILKSATFPSIAIRKSQPLVMIPTQPSTLSESILKVSTYKRKRTKLTKHKRKQRIKKIKRKSARKRALKNI